MIERMVLHNFQCHRKLTIDLDPQVTSIVGPSDKGKSAVLRALKWLASNRPGGVEFIKHGTKEARVDMDVSGHRLQRIRSKSKNIYTIDGNKRAAIGKSSVPEDIIEVLNMEDINFQGQYDSPFWLCETSGEVSRQLNKIVNLDIIDTSIANILSTQRSNNSVITVLKEQLKTDKKEIKTLAKYREMDKQLKPLETTYLNLTRIKTQGTRIREILTQGIMYKEKVDRGKMGLLRAKSAMSVGSRYKATTKQVKDLKKLVGDIQSTRTTTTRTPMDTTPLTSTKGRVEVVRGQVEDLGTILGNVHYLLRQVTKTEKQVVDLQEQIQKLTKGKCPACGKTTTK